MAAVMVNLPKLEKWKQKNPSPHGDYNSVAISADGSKVVGGTFYYNENGTIPSETVGMFAWDGSGTHLRPPHTYSVTALPDARAGVESVAISKDGSWAASGGLMSPGVGFLHVYDSAGNPTSLHHFSTAVRGVALSSDGSYLVAASDVLYVFKRNGNAWSAPVTVADPQGNVRRVDISDDGQWIATSIDDGWTSLVRNQLGTGGNLSVAGKWQLLPRNPGKPYVQHVAVAGDGSAYAAAGANGKVYYFDIAALQNGPLTPRWHHDGWGKSTCRWVAISKDGSHVAAVFSFDPNPASPNTPSKGRTYFLKNLDPPGPGGKEYDRLWTGSERTAHGPNAVSMGQTSNGDYYIAVADGTWKTAGGFYLFDGSNGDSKWGGPPDHNFSTTEMNYCVAMSADATAIVGGGNDGYVYYFTVP